MSIFSGIPLISNKLNELKPGNSQYGTNSHNCNADGAASYAGVKLFRVGLFRTIIDFQWPLSERTGFNDSSPKGDLTILAYVCQIFYEHG
jgi:hypothetical protein